MAYNPDWMYEEDKKEDKNEARLLQLIPQLNAPPVFITTTIDNTKAKILQAITDKRVSKQSFYENKGLKYFGNKGEKKVNLDDSDSTLIHNEQ
jgi:hypothetical protein